MHLTYADTLDRTSLQQGDVLLRTPAIDALLADVHPHYLNADYRYLMVLTQSCDLVRRFGEDNKLSKARYISVAAVRPLERVLAREIEKYQRTQVEREHRLCEATHRDKVEQFLGRLFNNNEEEFFYLHPSQHPDAPEGLSLPHCTFLALSIALKSELHYDTCLQAKILQLNDSFQHKLGWLVGKMYSRVGTDDWVPSVCTRADFDKSITSVVDSACAWVEPNVRRKLLKQLKALPPEELTTERALKELEQLKATTPKKKELLVERLGQILEEQDLGTPLINRIKNLVKSDPDIADCVAK